MMGRLGGSNVRSRKNAVSWVRGLRVRARFSVIAGLLVLTYLLGMAAVVLIPPGSQMAVWWPAAGAGVVAALCARRRRWGVALLVGLITVGSNYVAGRPLAVSIGFGIANFSEAWLISAILSRGTGGAGLRRMSDVARLLVSTLAGSILMGLIAGAIVGTLEGGRFLETLIAVMASHAAAVIVMVPPALVVYGGDASRNRLEYVAQIVGTFAVIGFVFSPTNTLPLAFLSLPILSCRLSTSATAS